MRFLLFLVFLTLNDLGLPCDVLLPSDVLKSCHLALLKHDVEQSEVAQEQKGQKVEEASDANNNFKFDEQNSSVRILVRLNSRTRGRRQMVNHETIRNVMH